MLCRDPVLLHEVVDPWISFNFPSFSISPGWSCSLWGFSSSLGVSLVFGRVAPHLVADEAFVVPHMLSSFTGREIDLVCIHGIRVSGWSSGSVQLGQWDKAVSPASELPESYYISIKFSCFVEPLFPFPTCLFLSFREGSGSHHDSKLVGYSSLKGVYQNAVEVDPTACLSQFKGGGILVEVTVELVHAEGIDSLDGSIFNILWDEGFLKGVTWFF